MYFLMFNAALEYLNIVEHNSIITLPVRIDFGFRNGILAYVDSVKEAYVVVQASTIRYRRPLNFLQRYTINTRIVSFDER